MSVFAKIWAAFGRIADAANAVADNLNGLAKSFEQANANVRANLHLEEQTAHEVPALPAPVEQQGPAPEEPKKGRAKATASASL